MVVIKCLMILVVLTFLWTLIRGDAEVFCVFGKSCILPCEFQFSSDPVIHWTYMTTRDLVVHSYYNSQDQLGHQEQRFRNRTSLFQDQISRGNSSLLLRGVQVQDQGMYECFTSTTGASKRIIINLKIDAPVTKINIRQEGTKMICSSERIYPEPELTWSTTPPLFRELQPQTRVHQTEDQLYSISSSLMVSDRGSDLIYSCTVTTRKNQSTASKQKTDIPLSAADIAGRVAFGILVAVMVIMVVVILADGETRRDMFSFWPTSDSETAGNGHQLIPHLERKKRSNVALKDESNEAENIQNSEELLQITTL